MKPTATGPSTLANEGAMPSQLNTRIRSVPSRANKPALRWIVSMPMLAPVPLAAAAAHSRARCAGPSTKHADSASSRPPSVSAAAMRTGRW